MSPFVPHRLGGGGRFSQRYHVSTLIQCSISLVTAPEVSPATHDNHHYSSQHYALSLTASLHQWVLTSVFYQTALQSTNILTNHQTVETHSFFIAVQRYAFAGPVTVSFCVCAIRNGHAQNDSPSTSHFNRFSIAPLQNGLWTPPG